MTLQQIYYAIVTAKEGSMNKAATALYISQPSLTSAIKELEKDAGIIIFRRTGRGIVVTPEGEEFLNYARQLYQQYELLKQKYGTEGNHKRKFRVSTQHYSFAIKAFVETVKKFDMLSYEFAIMETKTYDVIDDVGSMRSEIGILYQSDNNRKIMQKMFREHSLEFHPLIKCDAYVYIYKDHPLAKNKSISFDELEEYPCLSFEQGENGSTYFAEEILSEMEYSRIIKAADRATMLNLMV